MNEQVIIVLKEQCRRVGIEEDKFNRLLRFGFFKLDDWYMQMEWTLEEQKDFEAWLVNHLYNNKEAREAICHVPLRRKKHLRRVASMWAFCHGWRFKDDTTIKADVGGKRS